MTKLNVYEAEVLRAYESGKLKPVATKAELARMRAAARATASKDRRINIRLSSGDLQDIQARALEEGMPYQTLIASILHKYVSGRFAERLQGGLPIAAEGSTRKVSRTNSRAKPYV